MAQERKNQAEGAKKRAKETAAKILKDEDVRRALRNNHARARETERGTRRRAAG